MSENFLRLLDRLQADLDELREVYSEEVASQLALAFGTNGNVNVKGHSRRKPAVGKPKDYEELKVYVMDQLKLTENDAAALWEHWLGNGFRNGGSPMASWRATASCWERKGIFFPSLQPLKRMVPK